MPNRMLRDWTKSISMDNLSLGAERFFTRLIMKADDYGSFYADPKILRSELFPLKIDEITNGEIESWLEECLEQSLIIIYTAEGKNLLRIVNFGQRLQNKRNKFPDPDGITVNHRESPPELEYELEIENEVEAQLWPTFDDFWGLYGKKVGKPKAEKKWKKIPQVARIAFPYALTKRAIVRRVRNMSRARPDNFTLRLAKFPVDNRHPKMGSTGVNSRNPHHTVG